MQMPMKIILYIHKIMRTVYTDSYRFQYLS